MTYMKDIKKAYRLHGKAVPMIVGIGVRNGYDKKEVVKMLLEQGLDQTIKMLENKKTEQNK